MLLYWYLFRFRARRFLVYPTEAIANILRRVLELTFFIFLWTVLLKNSNSGQTQNQLISYFLVATGVSEIVMAKWGGAGKIMADSIRTGKLSNYLIKPTSVIPSLYFSELGVNVPRLFLAVVYLTVGLYLNPPTTLLSIVLFILFFIAAFFTAFCYVILLGCMYFYIPQASGIKNAFEHMSRIFSGAAIPLTFFPNNILRIVRLLPFQVMIYAPTKALSTNVLDSTVLGNIVVAYFWMVVFLIFARMAWGYSIKHYEAAGI